LPSSSTAQSAAKLLTIRSPRRVPTQLKTIKSALPILVYFCVVLYLAVHCFRYNAYGPDTAEFIANVVALKTSNAVQIRDTTSNAIRREAPTMVAPHILGEDLDTNEARVRRHKFQDAYTLPQFLPYFSIKPLYIEALHLANVLGFSLVRSIAAVSTVSFCVIALVFFLWLRQLNGSLIAAAVFLFCPEVRILGQEAGPDAMSVAVLITAFYCLFFDYTAAAVALLMISVWVRPETSILVILCIVYLAWKGKLPAWMAALFIGFSLLVPPLINHFGGSYGWKALYSHTFKYVEMEPGQFTPVFTFQDYLRALSAGIHKIMDSSALVFMLLFAVGYKYQPKMRSLLTLCALYSAIRFIIYPNYEFRYFSIFYVIIALAVCAALAPSSAARFTSLLGGDRNRQSNSRVTAT
jgi:hypothetical protein